MSSRKYIVPVLALLFTFAGIGAYVAPVNACVCTGITFTPSGSSSSSPITITKVTTIFGPSGNTISYTDFGTSTAEYMDVSITTITSGWTVTITSPNTVSTISSTHIILGTANGASSGLAGSFSYTITVTAPSSPLAAGHFTINANPAQYSEGYYDTGSACASLTVYLKTTTPFPPPGVPMFPLGMGLLMVLAIPALLLAKRKFAGTPTL